MANVTVRTALIDLALEEALLVVSVVVPKVMYFITANNLGVQAPGHVCPLNSISDYVLVYKSALLASVGCSGPVYFPKLS